MPEIAPNKDIFGRNAVTTVRPITADMCMLTWTSEGDENAQTYTVAGATNISISYQQQVIRRRTLASTGGSPIAVIYPTQPNGSMRIQRLFANWTSSINSESPIVVNNDKGGGSHDIFSYPGWNVCNGTAMIKVTFNGTSAYQDCTRNSNRGYIIRGAVVTGYNISAEAEGLTIVDDVSIEFLQLEAS